MKFISDCILTTYFTFKNSYFLILRGCCLVLLIPGSLSYLKAQEETFSELQKLSNSEYPAEEVSTDLQKAISLTDYGNYNDAIPIFEKLELSELIHSNDSMRMAMLESRAFMCKVMRKNNQALADYMEMLDYYTSLQDFNNMAKVETLLAEYYRARALGDLSYRHLEIAEEIIDNHEVDPCNISFWFSRRAANESQFRSNANNVGFFSQKALELANEPCAQYTKALILNELAYLYGTTHFEDVERIVSHYEQSSEILRSMNRQRDLATVQHNLAVYYARRGEADKSLEVLEPIIALAELNQWHSALEDLYLIQMTIFESKGWYKEAYDISRKAYQSKISLMVDQYAIDVEELQAVHDRELAEKALAEAEVRADNNQRALFYTVGGSTLLAISTLTVVFLFLRVRKKNFQLSVQQEAIEKTNEQLSYSLEEKEVLYKELNHRVKNNLMVLSGLIYLQEQTDENESSHNLYAALRNRIQTMAMVHEKLYGLESTTRVNFQEYLEELSPLICNTFRKGSGHIPINIDCKELSLPINKAIPLALIFNELITNSIKHLDSDALANGIFISCRNDNGATLIEYRDHGSGLPIGLELSTSKSMGMRIVNLMIQQLKATFDHTSSDEGLRFTIRFD